MVAARRLRAWVPRWWRGEGGWAGRVLGAVLLPAEVLYRVAVSARNQAFDRGWLATREPPIPAVSIGNLAVGGAGKTPISAWLAARLAARGLRPALVLSGYGADEVLLHRELNPEVPVFVATHRLDAVRQAAAAGCRVAVVDDGFQHRALGRALDVVLVAAESWTPAPRLLPRGPWRETPAALRRAHLVVVTRKTAPDDSVARVVAGVRAAGTDAEVFVCALEPAGLSPLTATDRRALAAMGLLAGREVLAVAALADPEPFREQLSRLGARAELMAFPDHHDFTGVEAGEIATAARGRMIVLTRKDAVKLRPLLPGSVEAYVLEQRVRMDDAERFEELAHARLARETTR